MDINARTTLFIYIDNRNTEYLLGIITSIMYQILNLEMLCIKQSNDSDSISSMKRAEILCIF